VRGRAGRVGTFALASGLVLVLAAVAFGGLYATGRIPGGLFDDAAPTPAQSVPQSSPSPAPTPAGPVLAPAAAPAGGGGAGLDETLLDDPDLGGDPGAYLVDVGTGEVLLDRDAGTARTPASVAKLLTAAGALVALGATERLQTRTVVGADPREVVLVGGGDTTLTVRPPREPAYPRPASLTDLADATAAKLRLGGLVSVTVRVDDSLFTGPAVSPDWEPSYVPGGEVSPVSALTVDAGRIRPGAPERVGAPAVRAGELFADLLSRRGLTVTAAVTRAAAPSAAEVIASVTSPQMSVLVESMLATSDDDLAESLFRLVAAGQGGPATFDGGRAAVTDVLVDLGVPTDGLRLLDGSGLARGSLIAPETLGALLSLAATTADPDLAGLRSLVTGLPVAGFSGTLAERFGPDGAREGAGVVRAKTGTLTGVSSLAGVVTTGAGNGGASGARVLAFSVMSDDVAAADTLGARDALDRIVASLAGPDG